jgi:septin 7
LKRVSTRCSLTLLAPQILSDLEFHGINIFQAPIYDDDDDESILEAEEIARAIPFAIVGSSNTVRTRDGRVVRGRAYPWGVVEVDNPAHCDFGKLRQLLIRTNMEELREHTNDVLFEAWRTERLLAMGITQDPTVFEEIKYACLPHVMVLYAIGLCADDGYTARRSDCEKSA